MIALLSSLVSNLVLLFWIAAAVGLWWLVRGNSRRGARLLTLLVLLLLWLLPCRGFAELFLRPLENRFPQPRLEELKTRGLQQVVVLTGGGFVPRGELESSAFPQASATRFLAGLELCARLGPNCRLIFSGAAGRGRRELQTALSMEAVARDISPDLQIVAEGLSGNTAEHPQNVRPLLVSEELVLITSARHLPRAVAVFRHAGLDPIPFPVDRWSSDPDSPGSVWRWIPSLDGLQALHAAWREILALAFYHLRGHLS